MFYLTAHVLWCKNKPHLVYLGHLTVLYLSLLLSSFREKKIEQICFELSFRSPSLCCCWCMLFIQASVCVLRSEDLARPATTLFLHNLTGTLDSAIRATNAQFDEPETLQRLDVRLLEVMNNLSWNRHLPRWCDTVFEKQQCKVARESHGESHLHAFVCFLRSFVQCWRDLGSLPVCTS